jgi:hypothetical protein
MCYAYTPSNTLTIVSSTISSSSSSTLSSTKTTSFVTTINNIINEKPENNIIDSLTTILITDNRTNPSNISNNLNALSKILQFKFLF